MFRPFAPMNWSPAQEGRELEPRKQPLFTIADRVALIAAAGIVLSCAVWIGFAWFETLLGTGRSLSLEVLDPTVVDVTGRLTTIVLVLIATLLLQVLYARHLRLEHLLDLERERTLQIYEHSPEAIVCVDRDRRVLYLNPAARRLEPEASHGSTVGGVCSEARADSEACAECPVSEVLATGEVRERTLRERSSDGGERWIEQTIYPVLCDDGRVGSAVAIMRDISERARAQRVIRRMAFHDSLTGLPNRLLFSDRLDGALAHARRHGELVVVAFVDLNDFKAINDTFGHAVGDGVLCAVSERLGTLLRAEDTIARHSGDEFTVLARIENEDGIEPLMERIIGGLKTPVVVEGHSISVSASLGLAVGPFDGEDAGALIKSADTAMYQAKEWGHSVWRRYEPGMSAEMAGRFELEAALRVALDNDEFVLHYQPQVDTRTNAIVGVEALLRWNHPAQGLLAPHVFLPLAEQSGLIGPIGRWVLRTACAQMKEWLDAGIDVGKVAVNLTSREFIQEDVVSRVRQALASVELEPSRLELEITESVAMHGTQKVLFTLLELRDLGVRIAVDDFGTGFSAMSYLRRFPIHTLKIAQVFMRDAHVDPQSAAIATMIVELSRELGLEVIAEGVEHPRQLEFLERLGCPVVQGFMFSEPVPPGRVPELVEHGFAEVRAQDECAGPEEEMMTREVS